MPIDCDEKLLSDLSSSPVLFPPFAQSHPISFVRGTVADNLLDSAHRRVSDRIQAYALFPDPPLGRCGMTDAKVRKSGRPVLATKLPMSKVSRAVEKGETQGFIKISVDAETKYIMGAAILGIGGDEITRFAGRHVCKGGVYGSAARNAYSSDGCRISPHRLVQTGTLCVSNVGG
ncbi:hypothetical protein [Nitrosospira sp. Nsp14]|uniref:hypothetical protein n=1 Tax=Nitrosospira sp. Nsp14 TaxID=1855333 RepID=UPI00210CD095|nr:hypothetical protein [Nitrosospira sp. Nsp14]